MNSGERQAAFFSSSEQQQQEQQECQRVGLLQHASLTSSSSPPLIHNLKRNDVVLGRDRVAYEHEGNKLFRQIIRNLSDQYHNKLETKKEKARIVDITTNTLLQSGIRFLKRAPNHNNSALDSISDDEDEQIPWTTCTFEEVRKKVGHAFRDCRGKRQKKQRKQAQRQKQQQLPSAPTSSSSCELSSRIKGLDQSVAEAVATATAKWGMFAPNVLPTAKAPEQIAAPPPPTATTAAATDSASLADSGCPRRISHSSIELLPAAVYLDPLGAVNLGGLTAAAAPPSTTETTTRRPSKKLKPSPPDAAAAAQSTESRPTIRRISHSSIEVLPPAAYLEPLLLGDNNKKTAAADDANSCTNKSDPSSISSGILDSCFDALPMESIVIFRNAQQQEQQRDNHHYAARAVVAENNKQQQQRQHNDDHHQAPRRVSESPEDLMQSIAALQKQVLMDQDTGDGNDSLSLSSNALDTYNDLFLGEEAMQHDVRL